MQQTAAAEKTLSGMALARAGELGSNVLDECGKDEGKPPGRACKSGKPQLRAAGAAELADVRSSDVPQSSGLTWTEPASAHTHDWARALRTQLRNCSGGQGGWQSSLM